MLDLTTPIFCHKDIFIADFGSARTSRTIRKTGTDHHIKAELYGVLGLELSRARSILSDDDLGSV
jgi:hypothetical protein